MKKILWLVLWASLHSSAYGEIVKKSPCTISVMPNTLFMWHESQEVLASKIRVVNPDGEFSVCCDPLYLEREADGPGTQLFMAYGVKDGKFWAKIHKREIGETA